jgi:hypothetical protein
MWPLALVTLLGWRRMRSIAMRARAAISADRPT